MAMVPHLMHKRVGRKPSNTRIEKIKKVLSHESRTSLFPSSLFPFIFFFHFFFPFFFPLISQFFFLFHFFFFVPSSFNTWILEFRNLGCHEGQYQYGLGLTFHNHDRLHVNANSHWFPYRRLAGISTSLKQMYPKFQNSIWMTWSISVHHCWIEMNRLIGDM